MIVSSEPKWYRYNKNYQVIPSRTTGQIEVTLRDLLNAFREKSSRKNEFRPLQMFGIYTCTIPEPNDDQAYLSHEVSYLLYFWVLLLPLLFLFLDEESQMAL